MPKIDQETLATLRQMVSSRQVDIFPETYIDQPIGEFLSAGLANELDAQLKAGDALAAGYLVGGPELAIAAATRCVGLIGAMPSSR